VDSLDPDNPPSHPALLEGLAGEFAASGCDVRHLLRGLLLSRAYQRSHAAVPGNAQASAALFARGGVKVVSAESFYESLVIAAGNALDPKGGSGKIGSGKSKGPLSTRSEFLKHFGSAGTDLEPGDYVQGIPQVLHLLNDPDLVAPCALVEQVVREKGEPDEMAARIFVGVLSRRPTDEELAAVRETLSSAKSPAEGLQSVWWALINSPEFATVP
jgi:hypothetical protein